MPVNAIIYTPTELEDIKVRATEIAHTCSQLQILEANTPQHLELQDLLDQRTDNFMDLIEGDEYQ